MSSRNYSHFPYVGAEEVVESTDNIPASPPEDAISLVTQDLVVEEEMIVDDGHASPPFIEDEPQFDDQNNDVGAIVEIESDNSNENPPPLPAVRIVWHNNQSSGINNVPAAAADAGIMINDENAIVHVDNIVDLSTQSAKKRKL